MRRRLRSHLAPLLLALALAAAGPGCFVEGRCLGDDDCGANARCSAAQRCETCRSAAKCAGLLDRNPRSPTFGETLELIDYRGEVVLVYLANGG